MSGSGGAHTVVGEALSSEPTAELACSAGGLAVCAVYHVAALVPPQPIGKLLFSTHPGVHCPNPPSWCPPPAPSWRQYRFHVEEADYEVVVTAVVEGDPMRSRREFGSIDMFLKAEQPAGAVAGAGGSCQPGEWQAAWVPARPVGRPASPPCRPARQPALPACLPSSKASPNLALQDGVRASMTCAPAGTPPPGTAR